MRTIAHSLFSCCKADASTLVRELIITFGRSGYGALFEIRDRQQLAVGAVRYRYESDYC